MAYKVTGMHGLTGEDLSLEDARQLVNEHLEKPEFRDYRPFDVLNLRTFQGVVFVTYSYKSEDVDAPPVTLAEIEYMKGGDDAL